MTDLIAYCHIALQNRRVAGNSQSDSNPPTRFFFFSRAEEQLIFDFTQASLHLYSLVVLQTCSFPPEIPLKTLSFPPFPAQHASITEMEWYSFNFSLKQCA